MRQKQTRAFYYATFFIVASALIYCSWPLGYVLNPAAMRSGLASELGAVGQPYYQLFIWGDVVSGALLGLGCILLIRILKPTRWIRICLVALAVYGVCGALDAALPERCVPSLETCGPVLRDPQLILHGVFDLLGSAALIVTLIAAWWDARSHNKQWLPWIYWVGGGGVLFALLSGLFLIISGPGYWAQRYYITLSCIWVASIPFILRSKYTLAKVFPERNS